MHFPNKPVAALCLAAAVTVQAQDATFDFDIPAQPVHLALDALAKQAGLRLTYGEGMIEGITSPGVRGRHNPRAALAKALTGTGLTFRFTGEGTVVIQRVLEVSELSPVTVTATRTERRADEVPASVSVISARDLERQHLVRGEDALKNVEGIDFNTSDASAFSSTPMIRGIGGSFSGTTSSVLMDGMVTDSSISSVAGRGGFGFLAPHDIERIEVVRGPASALYGPNVVGGVVNVIPRRWQGETGAEAHADLGSHNAKALGAAVGTSNERFDIRLSAYDFRTEGFVAKSDPDPWGAKDIGPRGWEDKKVSLNGAVRPTEDQEIGFAVQQFRTKQNYVGGESLSNSERREGDAYTLSYQKNFSTTNRFKLSYRHLDLSQSWIDSPDGMGVGRRRSFSHTVEAQVDLHPSDRNTLIFGASYQTADYDAVSITDGYRDASAAKSTGLFVQDEHRFGDLVATLGGRFDRFSQGASYKEGMAIHQGTNENVFNPRLGLRYHWSPRTSFYASVGKAFLPANADFKYLGSPARWKDNPGLNSETSITYEMGINQKLAWAALRAAVYHTDYKDKISAISVGASVWPRQFVNLGKVSVDGLELGIDGELAGGWHPYANYAYTRSIIKENPGDPVTVGKHIQRIAPHKFNLGVIYAPGDAWSASLAGRYVSERYFSDNNAPDHRAAAYFVSDAKVSVKLPFSRTAGQWSAYLAVNNLFDRKYTVWEYEYADGRNVWVGLSARF